MNTNLVGTNGVPVTGATDSEPCYWLLVATLMLLAAAVGAIALYCYQRKFPSEDEKIDKWSLLQNFGMGLGAVALVPAFLRTVSSTLLIQMEASVEARFVFVSFCVAATFTARQFLTLVPKKILDTLTNVSAKVAKAESKAEKTQEQMNIVVEAVANKTASPHPELSSDVRKKLQAGPVAAYDAKTFAVIRALLNPRFPKSRSLGGVAFDTGLTFPDALTCLRELEKLGDAHPYEPLSEMQKKQGNWWALTSQGRRKFESALGQFPDDDDLLDTGLE